MLFYSDVPGAVQTTNATPNTANDCFFIVAGTTAGGVVSRNVGLRSILPAGRGAGLTTISGISYRLEKWTTTASSGGTAITPTPDDPGAQAAKHTAGYAAGAVTSGTGGPLLCLSIGSGVTSPGGYIAPTLDEAYMLQAGEAKSLDVFNISGTASLPFEMSATTFE